MTPPVIRQRDAPARCPGAEGKDGRGGKRVRRGVTASLCSLGCSTAHLARPPAGRRPTSRRPSCSPSSQCNTTRSTPSLASRSRRTCGCAPRSAGVTCAASSCDAGLGAPRAFTRGPRRLPARVAYGCPCRCGTLSPVRDLSLVPHGTTSIVPFPVSMDTAWSRPVFCQALTAKKSSRGFAQKTFVVTSGASPS